MEILTLTLTPNPNPNANQVTMEIIPTVESLAFCRAQADAQALTLLERVVARAPPGYMADACATCGTAVLAVRRDAAAARALFERALALEPGHSNALCTMGTLLAQYYADPAGGESVADST